MFQASLPKALLLTLSHSHIVFGSDITLARQNVMTIIKGSRSMPFQNQQTIEKQERKYGEFTMTFGIPHNFEVLIAY